MDVHKLKTWSEFFEDVYTKKKNFDVRPNDRDFKVGDRVDLIKYDPVLKELSSKHCHRWITYILEGGQFGIQEGYCVLGLTDIEPD